jgi:hypothetical protein
MELNHYGDVILGAVATEDIVEGRFVRLTSHSFDYDYGSKTDLPGCVRPTTAALAGRAIYCIAFAEDNRSLPIYVSQPHYDWALREGWEQTTNAPFTSLVRLTHPNNQECQTIPSGSLVKLYGESTIVTLNSGCYVYSSEVETPGCQLTVANVGAGDAAADVGKPKYGTTYLVAEVIQFHDTNSKLTIKIY